MYCPYCMRANTQVEATVYRTNRQPGKMERHRRCPSCGRRYRTVEVEADRMENMIDPDDPQAILRAASHVFEGALGGVRGAK